MKVNESTPAQESRFRRHQKGPVQGPHVIVTEVQTLDQALQILEQRRQRKKANESLKVCERKRSLAQDLGLAKAQALLKDVHLANGDAAKGATSRYRDKLAAERKAKHVPHPFRDLPEAVKPGKAREMFASGNWGCSAPAGRRLAALFGVSKAVMAEWLGIEIWDCHEYHARYKRSK